MGKRATVANMITLEKRAGRMVAIETCKHCDKSRRLSPDEVRTIRGRLSLTMHKAPLSAGAGKPAKVKKHKTRIPKPARAGRKSGGAIVHRLHSGPGKKVTRTATAKVPRDPVSHRRILRATAPATVAPKPEPEAAQRKTADDSNARLR